MQETAKGTMRRLLILPLLLWTAVCVQAHPLGNFTINHYARIDSRVDRLLVKLVIDMAEIPAFQELSAMGLARGSLPDEAQRRTYLAGMAERLSREMTLRLNQRPTALRLVSSSLEFPEGQGGLRTLRAVFWWEGATATEGTTVEFSEESYPERAGWREIVVNGGKGTGLRSQSLSRELTAYPENMLFSPLNERRVSFTSRPTLFQEVAEIDSVARPDDSFAALVSSSYSDPRTLLGALLVAFLLGAFHALSPGHGKTLVAAYLVASRANVKNALLLGVSVTFTHTASVFLLGLVTLTLSQYVLPERLYPWIGVFSGLAVVVMGTYMLMQRLQSYFGIEGHSHSGIFHTHGDGGHEHTGAGWRGVLWMGMTGGALPCPSALVVLLGAIAMHRIVFGMLLIVAFSLGLASVLVLIGVLLVKARGLLERIGRGGRVAQLLPVLSAFVITLVGVGISVEALGSGNVFSEGMLARETLYATIGIGFALGLHHALDTDHIVAVSAIVSEQRKWWQSSLVGMVWGLGHTTSLFLVAIAVIFFKLVIPDTLAKSLELCVAFMLIGLGVNLVLKTYRKENRPVKFSRRPFLIGMVHGLAGSAALMLVVLTTIPSPLAGIIYVMVFGLGSVGGMLVMSSLIGLPIVFTADRFERWAHYLKFAAGTLSAIFGLLLAWELLVDEGLFRELLSVLLFILA